MKQRHKQSGLILSDVVIGLMIGAIVLTAAAAMADALSHGKRATEQMSRSANYLAQLQTRMADLTMRAESVEARTGGGVTLTYENGRTADVYADLSNRIVVDEGGISSYLSDSAQTGVTISTADADRVVIAVELSENIGTRTYVMTATRRGGKNP
jgi:gas vesicle protein